MKPFDLPDQAPKRPEISPCHGCGAMAGRKVQVGGLWICRQCIPSQPCSTCGAEADAKHDGIGRFATNTADSDEYGLRQYIVFRCPAGHKTNVEAGTGPGANRGGPGVEWKEPKHA